MISDFQLYLIYFSVFLVTGKEKVNVRLVLLEEAVWMINRGEYLDETVIFTLSLVVLIRSFMSGFFIMPIRLCASFVASYLEAN